MFHVFDLLLSDIFSFPLQSLVLITLGPNLRNYGVLKTQEYGEQFSTWHSDSWWTDQVGR